MATKRINSADATQEENEYINHSEALRLARNAPRILSSAVKYVDGKTGRWILRELGKMHGRLRKEGRVHRGDLTEVTLVDLQKFERIVIGRLRRLLRAW
jgi:hypothetical protein